MANRKQHEHADYADTEVLPAHFRVEALDDAAAEAHDHYREYVRSLEDVPVLVDVVSEPPRTADDTPKKRAKRVQRSARSKS